MRIEGGEGGRGGRGGSEESGRGAVVRTEGTVCRSIDLSQNVQ